MKNEEIVLGLDLDACKERIASLIEASGLTDKEISSRLTVTQQAVYKWRRKKGFLDISNLYALSVVLGVDIREFFVPYGLSKYYFILKSNQDVEEQKLMMHVRLMAYCKALNSLTFGAK